MADPFEVLRAPIEPVMPDIDFANRLRARIERALTLPKGVTVSDLDLDLDLEQPMESGVAARAGVGQAGDPLIRHAVITPYLSVDGAAEAVEWYAAAFGAVPRSEPIIMPDGRVGHAEIVIGGALIMLADAFPEIGFLAPSEGHPGSVTLHLAVDDVEGVIGRAVSVGAELVGPVREADYGKSGSIRDPFGHKWQIFSYPVTPNGHEQTATWEPRHGDIGYVSLWVHDTPTTASFFSSVLGWQYAPASGPQGRRVEGLSLHHGIWGEEDRSNLFCCYAVEDVDAAAERVRAAGGTASEPQLEPYGRLSECVDTGGVRFAIYQPPGGVNNDSGARHETSGRNGDWRT